MTREQERELGRFLEGVTYRGEPLTEKAVIARVAKAKQAEKILNTSLESIVSTDGNMLRALEALSHVKVNQHGVLANAVRKYYEMRRGRNFPRIKDAHTTQYTGGEINEGGKISQGGYADKTMRGHGDLGEFKNVVQEFHQWLIDETDLTKNSANQYKVYIKKLCAEVDKGLGTGWFESLPMDPQKWESISAFIEKMVRTAKGDRDRKSWNDWRSAFHRFEDFLPEIADSWAITSKKDDLTEEPVQAKPISSSSCVVEKSVKNDANDENEEVVATYNHKELFNTFRSRLTTQNRYYPKFKLLFPTRLLTKIFKRSRPNAWEQWLEKGIENIGILKEDGGKIRFSEVTGLEFLRNGTVVVTKNDGKTFNMMTRTAGGSIREARTKLGLRDVSIDHVNPLENVLREKQKSLVGLKNLTVLFQEFNHENNGKFKERDEKAWFNVFFEAYRDKLGTKSMRDDFVEHDLMILNELEYELMDRKENTRKGKKI